MVIYNVVELHTPLCVCVCDIKFCNTCYLIIIYNILCMGNLLNHAYVCLFLIEIKCLNLNK